MIYSPCIVFYFIALGLFHCSDAYITPFTIRNRRHSFFRSVPEWLQVGDSGPEEFVPPSKITVRFINTPSGEDVVVKDVDEGQNLLFIGDHAGVKIPRACRNGLCGTCICQVQDPSAIASESNPREGFATVRACSSKCFIPEGMTEMVVDVQNIRKKRKLVTPPPNTRAVAATTKLIQPKGFDLAPKKLSKLPDPDEEEEDDVNVSCYYFCNLYLYLLLIYFVFCFLQYNPLERFGEGWELEFRPAWKLNESQDKKEEDANPEDNNSNSNSNSNSNNASNNNNNNNNNAVTSSSASKAAPKSSVYVSQPFKIIFYFIC